jgi:hypothetical protein
MRHRRAYRPGFFIQLRGISLNFREQIFYLIYNEVDPTAHDRLKEDIGILEFDAVLSGRSLLTLVRNELPPLSGCKSLLSHSVHTLWILVSIFFIDIWMDRCIDENNSVNNCPAGTCRVIREESW